MTLPLAVEQALAALHPRIAITGAGGWLGMVLLELLEQRLDDVLEERVVCFGSTTRRLTLRSGRRVLQHPLSELPALAPAPTLLFHLAFLTKDRAEQMSSDEYTAANRSISDLVVGSLDRIGAAGVMVASSGAAAFADDSKKSDAMRLYGRLKREEEERFGDWADQRGLPGVISRIYNVSGPYINKHAKYALANFIMDALAGRPIQVRAARAVVRSYVAARDLMVVALSRLLCGTGGAEHFDTGGTPLELAEVAAAVAEQLGSAEVVRAEITDQSSDIYVGNPVRWNELLHSFGLTETSFPRQIQDTAEYMQLAPAPDMLRNG